MKKLTWEQIIKIEPKIQELYMRVEKIKKDTEDKESFCANDLFYRGGIKNQLSNLVGLNASKEELASSEAYDIVYEKLYTTLPDCRNCGEFSINDL